MKQKKDYKFTNKKHTQRGIMSTVLGMISLGAVGTAIYQSYLLQGNAGFNMGVVGLMVTIFAAVGVTLGFLSRTNEDRFVIFSYVGIILNIAALGCISVILYAGAYM